MLGRVRSQHLKLLRYSASILGMYELEFNEGDCCATPVNGDVPAMTRLRRACQCLLWATARDGHMRRGKRARGVDPPRADRRRSFRTVYHRDPATPGKG